MGDSQAVLLTPPTHLLTMKEETITKIKEALGSPAEGRNSMGASEALYDPYYMVGSCFTEEELGKMEETELVSLIKLANFANVLTLLNEK